MIFDNIVEALRYAKGYGGKLVKREYKELVKREQKGTSKVKASIYKGKDGYYMQIVRCIKI